MKYRFCILTIFIFALTCCSSPQKLYEKGNYFKAFDSVLKDIEGNKKDRKNLLLLNKSFSKMIDVSRDEMRSLEDGYEVTDLKHNLEQHEEVDKRYVKGRSYINDENDNKYGIFTVDKNQLLSDAYEEGKDLLKYYDESKNKTDARNAYYHFELVKKYGNDFQDINNLLSEARELATVIYNIDADLDSDFSYQWEVDRVFDDLEGESDFVKIVYDDSYESEDCSVVLDFSRLDVDESQKKSSQEFSKEIIDGYTTETDTSGNTTQLPIYKKVYGQVTVVSLTKKVSWSIDFDIVNSSINCDLKHKRFRESVEDRIERYELGGDDRAIPSEYKGNQNDRIKDTDDMVDELLEALYKKIRNYIY